jgi:cytoskeletal protein RodZ
MPPVFRAGALKEIMETETQPNTGTATDFGAHLRESRERRGLSLGELSRQTRIPEATLEALESERLERLPPDTYVRGFIRAYARAVQTPAVEPLARYEKATAAARASALAVSESAAGGTAGTGRGHWIVFAVLLAAAVGGAVFALWRA